MTTATLEQVWVALEGLTDPEIPVVTLRELGILRDVRSGPDGLVEVVITPTYSGCPAMGQIEDDVRATLENAGIAARVITQLSPAWTTDWMNEAAREKLRAYGIAPPHQTKPDVSVVRFMRRPAADPVAPPGPPTRNWVLDWPTSTARIPPGCAGGGTRAARYVIAISCMLVLGSA